MEEFREKMAEEEEEVKDFTSAQNHIKRLEEFQEEFDLQRPFVLQLEEFREDQYNTEIDTLMV